MMNQDVENVFIDFEAKKISEEEALKRLIALGLDPDDAQDQLQIYHGGDVKEIR